MAGSNKAAVVILTYNSRKWHELFLPLIVSEAFSGYDVYVVDHASPDDTSAYIRQNFPSVRLIQLTENHGFAWGYAQALQQINAAYYILLSADFEVTPGWFPPLLAAMEQHPEMAACQPKIRYYKDKAYFEYAGAAGGFKDSLGYLFCRGRLFETLEKDEGQYDDDCPVFWASGGCLVLRAEAYHEVGGLDADLVSHMEEVDLCWRLKNAGYRIGYVAGSTVFHVGGSVITYGSPAKTFYNFRNNLILLWKNERKARLTWLIPLRLILDGIAGLQFLLKGQYKLTLAVIKAHWRFFGKLRFWTKKRKAAKTSSGHAAANTEGLYPGSIVVAYFLKGIRKFSDLEF
ncbi:MAG TPA: glycosyltransferase family 2 protein [Edaphocola sp.]|nr:glycosyltransferase family 2 protein [Edaphocola sp.]